MKVANSMIIILFNLNAHSTPVLSGRSVSNVKQILQIIMEIGTTIFYLAFEEFSYEDYLLA